MNFRLLLLLSIVFLFPFKSSFSQEELQLDSCCQVRAIIDSMLKAIEGKNQMTFNFSKKERRLDDDTLTASNFTKLQVLPLKMYFKITSKENGAEILFKEHENDNEALINPNTFPYFNVNLSPTSSILRKGHHHTLYAVGFKYFSSLIQYFLDHYDNPWTYFHFDGMVKHDNQQCYKVILDYTDFKITEHKVKDEEDLTSIADSLHISDYMLVELNEKVDDYDDVDEGDVIKIPTMYAKKMVFYINSTHYFPVKQFIYDQKGLYEEYSFSNLNFSPIFDDQTFDRDNEEYDF